MNEEVLNLILSKFDGIEGQFVCINERFDGLEKRLDVLENDVRGIKDDVRGIKDDVRGIKDDVRGIKITLENEIWTGIKIISEGHIELDRKLDKAIKSKEESDMLDLRVRVLESDVTEIKKKIS